MKRIILCIVFCTLMKLLLGNHENFKDISNSKENSSTGSLCFLQTSVPDLMYNTRDFTFHIFTVSFMDSCMEKEKGE